MRTPPASAPPLPEGWENLPEEYEISYEPNGLYPHYNCRLDGNLDSWNDLPACVSDNGYKAWYQDGRRHRAAIKPAVIWQSLKVDFWLTDKQYFPDPIEINIANLRDVL